jgi:catechol-2,3-dioxygenase
MVQWVFARSQIFLLAFVSFSRALSPSSSTSSSSTMPSLGANALADVVTKAARHDESVSLDVHGIMWLEHINLVVGSKTDAEVFYNEFLGCSKDQSSSFHRNLGQQQFHLAENGDPAQVITGSIGLTVPSLDSIRERLPGASTALADTKFEILEDDSSKGVMTIICPWGNRFHLYDIRNDNLESTSDSTQKMVKLHAEGGSYGSQRLAVRGQPGIRYIEIACREGTSQAIANFYKEIFRCTVSKPSSDKTVVCAGPGVHLVFAENKAVTEDDMTAMQGVHICIYANDFKNLYRRLDSRKCKLHYYFLSADVSFPFFSIVSYSDFAFM